MRTMRLNTIENNRSTKAKEDQQINAFNQNLEKEREEEESNLLFKTLQKMKLKDYQQEKVEKKATKNLNKKIMQQISSKDEEKFVSSRNSKKLPNKDIIMQTLLTGDNSFMSNKHHHVSLRNIIRSKNNKDPTPSIYNEESELNKKNVNNPNNNNISIDRVNNHNTKTSEQSSQNNIKNISSTLKKSNFVKNLSKNKGFKRIIYKNQIDKLIEQVIEFEQETENINEVKNADEEDFFKFVKKKKETKISNPKLEKYLNFNKFRNPKIESEDYFDTYKKNQISPMKRQKNRFNFNNLDTLTKQIKDFKKMDRVKQKDILSKALNKNETKINFPDIPIKKTSRIIDNKLRDNVMINDKIQKKKPFDFFNQKKFVLMNYNGYSLYCPVIKKENISEAISINELYDLIFQS